MPYVLHRVVGSRTVLRTVDERNLRIGRGAGCELRLEDTAVALEHALVQASEREGGGVAYHLSDLGSVTGTYVNGEPVASARLRDGDEIAVGGFLIQVRHSDPEDPLFLHVRSADTEPRPGAPAVAVDAIDYGRRYRLRRRLWTKGLIAAVLALAAAALLAAIPAARRTDAFQPGDLTSFHSGRIDAAECSACHTPWRGVADASCQQCHGEGGIDAAPLHHPEAVAPASADAATLACTACHREHMGQDGLMPMNDAACRSCHGALEVASGVEPLFAVHVPSFAEHPEIRLTVADSGGAGVRRSGFRRVPVTDPAARRSDPTALAFGHAKHLAKPLPRSGTAADPTGELERLACDSCHRPAGADFAPVTFEQHCSRCHALTFDSRYPDRQAAHGPPEMVAQDLGLFYQEADRPAGASRSARDELTGFLGPGGQSQGARARGAREEAVRAESRLYGTACATCHAIELAGNIRPERVEDPAIPTRWLPHARFLHADHLDLKELECAACHGGVERSEETADVLLPTIASCTPCHGPGARSREGESVAAAGASFPVVPAPASCRTCHDYHSGNRFPGEAVAARTTGGAP